MKVKAVWDLLRLEHGIMYGIGVIIGVIISTKDFHLIKIFLGFFTALFLQASAFSLNDYVDYEVDLKNRRFDRPLVRGDLKRSDALLFSVILAPPGFFASYLISTKALLFAILITLLGYLYNIKIKEMGLIGNFYIALSMAAPFIFGGIIAIDGINTTVIIVSLLAFLSGVAREVMKGIEDVEGDALRDVKSIARTKGVKFASNFSALMFLGVVVLSFIPFLFIKEYFFDPKYLIPVILADLILVKTSHALFSKHVAPSDIKKFRKDTLIAFLFGLIGFIWGSF